MTTAQPGVDLIERRGDEDRRHRQHQPEVTPPRQDHGNTWRSTGRAAMGLKASFSAVPAMHDWGAHVSLSFTGTGGEVHAVLSIEDMRELAQRLLEMADAVEG